ncbi:glycosyltransferase family 2 protein [Butyrivibrio sp. JL13D10]|uniref:glycosyltransferase family 2 protein n=1 Tax=Butyrivibrio sp. JL13D10 TaxID=3236815 RepID=UPI0038B5BCEA
MIEKRQMNIKSKIEELKKEYTGLREQLANVQYEANEEGWRYSELCEYASYWTHEINSIKKQSFLSSRTETENNSLEMCRRLDRAINIIDYDQAVSYPGHSIKLDSIIPMGVIGENESIGLFIYIKDQDLLETLVEICKRIPFCFNAYISCSENIDKKKVMDLLSEIDYLVQVKVNIVKSERTEIYKKMEVFRNDFKEITYLLVMDMTDESASFRSMVTDLAFNKDYIRKILGFLKSGTAQMYISSAAERMFKGINSSLSYPYSAFYWIRGDLLSRTLPLLDSEYDYKSGEILVRELYKNDLRISVGSYGDQVVNLDYYSGNFKNCISSSEDEVYDLIKKVDCILIDLSLLVLYSGENIYEKSYFFIPKAIKKIISYANTNEKGIYLRNDIGFSEKEFNDIVAMQRDCNFLKFVSGDVNEKIGSCQTISEYADMRVFYIGNINCVNEKKYMEQYSYNEDNGIIYYPLPYVKELLVSEFNNGFELVKNLRNKNNLYFQELLMNLLTITNLRNKERFISNEQLKTLLDNISEYDEYIDAINDRLNEIEQYSINGSSIEYNYWYRDTMVTEEQLKQQKNKAFVIQPKFSIVVPVYRTKALYLRKLLESIKNQTYSNFEVCIVDASEYKESTVKEYEPRFILDEYANRDDRFMYTVLEKNMGISENTNEAIRNSSGDFIVFADHDDELTQDALYECAKTINEYPMAQIIYSDEDKIDKNSEELSEPHFKPDYNPEMLNSVNYFCHLLVIKRELLETVAEIHNDKKIYERPDFDGAQDYDLTLRCCEKAEELENDFIISYKDQYERLLKSGTYTSLSIRHIAKVLYHWRVYELSTSSGEEDVKPYTIVAGKKALADHCKRKGIQYREIVDGVSNGVYRIKYKNSTPLVSIIIPNKDHTNDLDKAIRSIWNGNYKNVEFIIVENNSSDDATWEYYDNIQKEIPVVKVIYYKGEFNYSAINNMGVRSASGDLLLFLNNDTEMSGKDSLCEMVALVQQKGVGIVGARLLYGDGSIQHAGIVVGIGGIAGNIFMGEESDKSYFNYAMFERNYSAVTAAVLICSRKLYDAIGGFSEELAVAFNDVDFCLKARTNGYRVAYSPYAVFHHYESKSRGTDEAPEKQARFHSEIVTFGKRWEGILVNGDPYYNPNLTLLESDFSLKRLGQETIGEPCYNELLTGITLGMTQ